MIYFVRVILVAAICLAAFCAFLIIMAAWYAHDVYWAFHG